ncbi:MAG: glycosyltransferase [Candidatus Competibacterales bacterium]|nr:glycosyltransferase [Candidatus Competibacterales bacterium]
MSRVSAALAVRSGDGTAAYLERCRDRYLRPVLLPDNGGIAGYNAGFEQARGDHILVLDDDSHPRDGATLARLIERLDRDPGLGVLACRIEDSTGRRVWSWHLPRADHPGPSMAFVGCGFAIRRELFRAIGWYPAEFFLYQNEIEVALRVRLAGYAIGYAPDCRVVHRTASAGRPGWRRVYYPTRNTLWLLRRYAPYPQALYWLGSRLLLGLGRAAQFGEWRAWARAVCEGLGTPVQRRPLPPALYREFAPFWRQNSLWRQLLGRT